MNKQEAINEIDGYSVISTFVPRSTEVIKIEKAKEIISQIDEPQKVVVPAFIDSFIRYAKAEGMSLFIAMDNAQNKESEWIITNEDTFARAWLDGYEVEQERLYTVEIPDPNRPDIATFLYKENGKVFIGTDIFLDEVPNYKWKNEPENQLTESEIKKDFEWAWNAGFAKEVK